MQEVLSWLVPGDEMAVRSRMHDVEYVAYMVRKYIRNLGNVTNVNS